MLYIELRDEAATIGTDLDMGMEIELVVGRGWWLLSRRRFKVSLALGWV